MWKFPWFPLRVNTCTPLCQPLDVGPITGLRLSMMFSLWRVWQEVDRSLLSRHYLLDSIHVRFVFFLFFFLSIAWVEPSFDTLIWNLLTVRNNVEPITLRKLLETYSNRTTDSVTSCGGNSISSYIYMHCILVEGMSAVLIHRDISLRYLSLIRNGSEVNVIMLPSNASGQAFFWLFSMYGSSHCSKGYWKSIPQGGLFGISKSNWLLLINSGIQIWCTLNWTHTTNEKGKFIDTTHCGNQVLYSYWLSAE